MSGHLTSILLIDDDAATNFIHKRILMDAGFTGHIQICDSAEDALDHLKKKGDFSEDEHDFPQLIFLDINMPGMDGWDFLNEYQTSAMPHKGLTIIMLTTSLNPDDRERALSEEIVSDFQNKPLTTDLFRNILATHFVNGT